MRYSMLGKTGLKVSVIGLGTVKLGRNEKVKYAKPFKLPSIQEAGRLLDRAAELGVNLLDTAPAYGNSENILGELLANTRHNWLICTKVGEEFDQGQSTFNFSAEHIRFSVKRSLARLGVEKLDIVLVHSDGSDVDIIKRHGSLEVLAQLQQEGVIGTYGMSVKTLEGGLLAAQHSEVLMVEYSMENTVMAEVLTRCQQLNCGVLIKKALANGHLLYDANVEVKQCLEFVFNHKAVDCVVSGTLDPNHLHTNVTAANTLAN